MTKKAYKLPVPNRIERLKAYKSNFEVRRREAMQADIVRTFREV